MRIFCFAHLRRCHYGWASNIHRGEYRLRRHPPLKILDAHPMRHHRRWAKQKISSLFSK